MEDKFVFNAEWFDTAADLIRPFMLTFHPSDRSVELVSS
jgi:hypothetical protein